VFGAETYVDRRNRLAAQMRSGLLLFLGNGESPMNHPDNTFHFR
jgi:Xaa-Pro aminopeptidase